MRMTMIDPRPLHRRSLELAGTMLHRVTGLDLTRPTPCAGWDLRQLIEHLIGQNHGFAEAVGGPADASAGAFAPRAFGDDPAGHWDASADRVEQSFAAAVLDRRVLLPEVSTELRLPTATVIGFHLVDTVVHGWDVATALGLPYQPDKDLVAAALGPAEQVPDGPGRLRPGAPFAPALAVGGTGDDWLRLLALLGRKP